MLHFATSQEGAFFLKCTHYYCIGVAYRTTARQNAVTLKTWCLRSIYPVLIHCVRNMIANSGAP